MPTHVTLSGHEIDYRPAPKVAAFLERLHAMLDDRKVSEQEMIGLAYAPENPILEQGLFPGRGHVTKEVLADPAYRVMTDLLARKHVQASGGDVEKMAAEHSLSVAETAAELGITEGAVRQAIAARRLPSWVKDGKHYLSPRAVRAFRISAAGPERQDERSEAEKARERRAKAKASPTADTTLEVRFGNDEGRSFRIRYPGELAEHQKVATNVHEARVPKGWKRVAIITSGSASSGGKADSRMFLLEPGVAENEIAWGDFYVRGRFNSTTINNGELARKTFAEFKAE